MLDPVVAAACLEPLIPAEREWPQYLHSDWGDKVDYFNIIEFVADCFAQVKNRQHDALASEYSNTLGNQVSDRSPLRFRPHSQDQFLVWLACAAVANANGRHEDLPDRNDTIARHTGLCYYFAIDCIALNFPGTDFMRDVFTSIVRATECDLDKRDRWTSEATSRCLYYLVKLCDYARFHKFEQTLSAKSRAFIEQQRKRLKEKQRA